MSTHPDKTLFDHEIADHLEETTRSWSERPILVMLDGSDTNRRFPIDKREITIGRDIMSDIILHDSRCSRHHARLTYLNLEQANDAPQIILNDLDSTNGSFVNGIRVSEHILRDRDKILLGSSLFGFFMRDESELEADERLYVQARMDALTGMLNRGVFNIEVQKEFERAGRYSRELALVMFDIDHFKCFNDTYGHQMGDFVLQELGRIIKTNIRGHDLGARYGGEEFAIILPETSLEGALIQAERLRSAVNNHSFTRGETSFCLSISLGLVALEPCIQDVEGFIQAADRALYQAKAEGRNCICWSRNGRVNTGSSTK
jgi:two-component system, cell cycle response regulator